MNTFGGAIVIAVGLYVAYYGWFEVRPMGDGGTDSVANDPVIAAAGKVQQMLAGVVLRGGGWPWAIALAVVLTTASVISVRRRRSRVASAERR